jgi:hypothetical protein
MNIDQLLAAGRVRLLLTIAGLAWVFGLNLDTGARIVAVLLVLPVLLLDAVTGQRPTPAPRPTDRTTEKGESL